jgi:hypothetical protein
VPQSALCHLNFELINNLWQSLAVPLEYMPTRSRRSIRLPGYDYSAAGYYFVTIHAVPGIPAFSSVDESGTYVNGLGSLIQQAWKALAERFPVCSTDVFTVQPNHVHGIVMMNAANVAIHSSHDDAGRKALGEIIRAFKSLSAIAVNRQLRRSGTPVWQRGFHDRVIRDEGELARARQYVAFNEMKTLQQRHESGGSSQS